MPITAALIIYATVPILFILPLDKPVREDHKFIEQSE